MFMCSTLCCFFCFEYLVVHNIVKHKCLLSKTLSSLIVCFQQSMTRWYLHLWWYLFYTWSSIASCSALACRSPRYSWRLHSSWKSQWLGFSISASAPHAIYTHWGPNHQTDASAIVVLIDLMNRFYGNVVFISSPSRLHHRHCHYHGEGFCHCLICLMIMIFFIFIVAHSGPQEHSYVKD